MQVATPTLSVSASNIVTFEDCQARFYHEKTGTSRLVTDSLAGDVGNAIHDALMKFHKHMQSLYDRGKLTSATNGPAELSSWLEGCLRAKRLERSNPRVADRLKKLPPGLNRVASLIIADMLCWSVDPEKRQMLVWAEQRLDHGPAVPAVDFSPGFLVSTRPDVIGLRQLPTEEHRAVVRDFKTGSEALDPAFDLGALVRAIWVLTELRDPRCPWFLAGRSLRLDRTTVDLEMVNLAFADRNEFLVAASVTVEQLANRREEIRRIVSRMGDVLDLENADEVFASPNGLCYHYCPFLHRCGPGQEHVRNSKGEAALVARLSGR